MSSQTLLAAHAIANAIITLFAISLFWQAWKTERRARKKFMDLTTKTVIEKIFGGLKQADDSREESRQQSGSSLKHRLEYGIYLKSLTNADDPMSFPEWRASRKEASHG
jgi:hypothetical protein